MRRVPLRRRESYDEDTPKLVRKVGGSEMSEEKPDDEERKAGWPGQKTMERVNNGFGSFASITQASEMEVEGNEQLIAIVLEYHEGILNKLISTRGRVQLDLETTNAGLHRFHQGGIGQIKPADPSHSYPSDVRLSVEGTLAAESRAYPQFKGDDHWKVDLMFPTGIPLILITVLREEWKLVPHISTLWFRFGVALRKKSRLTGSIINSSDALRILKTPLRPTQRNNTALSPLSHLLARAMRLPVQPASFSPSPLLPPTDERETVLERRQYSTDNIGGRFVVIDRQLHRGLVPDDAIALRFRLLSLYIVKEDIMTLGYEGAGSSVPQQAIINLLDLRGKTLLAGRTERITHSQT
ncbi:hypothetical protein BDZ89DRAFT_1042217 [Hymenopellis radicata]|nr:hypothetical protein BDZ89DRAFT_1042217 [Hymenopellis radicata]